MSVGVGVVGELWRYPVKSFRGEQLDVVPLDARGVVGDRAFAVRDTNGKLGSGKSTRRFRLMRDLFDFVAETDDDGVVVHVPGGPSLRVGDPALDAILTARYGEPVSVSPEEAVSHFDDGSIHALTTSSLGWVQTEYGSTGGDARRYRPNIVIDTDGVRDVIEDDWVGATVSIGSAVLRVTGTVERCVMPTLPQEDLPRSPGLLRFLSLRHQLTLGVYADVASPGTIAIGDTVTVER